MKKIIFTLALVAFAMSANAQWVLGGQIGLGFNGTHDDDYNIGSRSTASFAFAPKIGYQLNDKWQAGATIMFGYDVTRVYTGGADDNYDKTANLQFGIAPYARYTFGTWKNWSLFVEAQVVFGMSPESKTKSYIGGDEVGDVDNGDKATFLRLGVVPGMNYKLSDRFSMDLYLNIAKLAWNFYDTDGFDVNRFELGVSFDQKSIQNHLDLFGIGFNYSF